MTTDCNTTKMPTYSTRQISRRNAFHQAGHISAIYLINRKKNLPAVHFQIVIKPIEKHNEYIGKSLRIHHQYCAKLEGGRLIPELPYSYQGATRFLTPAQQHQCRCALEADVINILVAFLAEAKYVAQRDDEVFNANLVYLGALKYYGSQHDLLAIEGYMECLYPDSETERDQKLAELFLAAFSFVNEPTNWRAICLLAEKLSLYPQDIFTCEELIALLEPFEKLGINELSYAHTGMSHSWYYSL